MSSNRKILLFVFVCFAFVSLLKAQDTLRKNSFGVLGTYAYRTSFMDGPDSKVLDQRFENLQLYYLFKIGKRQDLGLHFSSSLSSYETVQTDLNSFLRQTGRGFGIIHRYYRKLFLQELTLFFQSSADIEFLKKREFGSSDLKRSEGTGLHIYIRPALRYYLNKNIGLELGFGALDLNTVQWWDVTGPTRERDPQNISLDLSFNLPTLMFGFFFQL